MHALSATSRLGSLRALAFAGIFLLACGTDSTQTAVGAGGSGTSSGGTSGSGGARVTSSGGTSTLPGSGGAASGGAVGTGGSTAGGGNLGTGGTNAVPGTGGSNRDAGSTGGAGGASVGVDAGIGGDGSSDGSARMDSATTDVRPISTGGTSTGGRTGTGGSATGGSTSGGTGTGGSEGKVPITVWMAGDSTMAGATCDGGGWGDQLGAFFNANVKVDNRSVAGRSIQTWLYEKNVSSTIGSDKECVLTATSYSDNWNAMLNATSGMKKGDYLIVEFGINDGDSACPRHVGTTLFQTYLATMAKAAKERGAQPIFLTSTSAIECSGQTATANRGFRTETKAAGTANDVPVIDMSALSAAAYTKAGLCPNSGDYTSTTSKVGIFFCDDHTHFAQPGATEIARVATTAMKDQGIGLASYLK